MGPTSPKKMKRVTRKSSNESEGSDDAKEPPNWRKAYENIVQMRRHRTAPVDSMGCDRCQDDDVEPKVQRFQCLVSLMLSAQTKDEVTFAAMSRLRQHGCSVDDIVQLDEHSLGQLIYPVGFWKKKARYIKQTAAILKADYDGDIPQTPEDLCKLPGVGPKMAHLCMSSAWNIQTGIGVDTHVHRICNRLQWTGPKGTKTPEQTRKALEDWLPEEKWSEINWLLVGFGQEICLPQRPRCSECLNKSLCPFGKSQTAK